MTVSYREIAADLRQRILEGRYKPDSKIPKLTELQEEYGAGYQTVRNAISMLEQEGLVVAVRRRGTVVRRFPHREKITRSQVVHRDDLGYYFDALAQSWSALQPPSQRWGTAPADIASAMGLEEVAEVLIRDRVMGKTDTGEVMQLATSYLPSDLARGTVLAERDTGPGGIYDRLEEMGHGPLQWAGAVTARMPSPEEAELLGMPTDVGIPLLRVIRTSTSPTGRVVEVNDTRMSAERFEIGYEIQRSPSACVQE